MRRRARSCGPPAPRRSPGSLRVRFDPDMVTELIKTAPVDVHPPRLEPGARPAARRRLGGVRDGRQPAQRRRPRPRPADRQPRRLPEPAAPRPVAQLGPLPGRLPGRAGRHPPRRPPPPRDLRRADADGQADPRLQPRSPAQHRHPRDGPDRARHRRRDQLDREPSIFTVVNSSSPLRLDAPMLQGIMEFAAHNQVVCITPFTLAGRDGARSRWPARWRSRTPRRWPGWS